MDHIDYRMGSHGDESVFRSYEVDAMQSITIGASYKLRQMIQMGMLAEFAHVVFCIRP